VERHLVCEWAIAGQMKNLLIDRGGTVSTIGSYARRLLIFSRGLAGAPFIAKFLAGKSHMWRKGVMASYFEVAIFRKECGDVIFWGGHKNKN
jgi:hypothetical protein